MRARLLESRIVSPEVRHFVFEVPDQEYLTFQPGQFLSFTKEFAGKNITRVSMSTNQGRKNKETGEWTNETTWHNLCAWGTIAEPMASLTKGTHVQVRGSIRHYQLPEQNGKPARTATEIVVNAFAKLDRQRRGEALQETAA